MINLDNKQTLLLWMHDHVIDPNLLFPLLYFCKSYSIAIDRNFALLLWNLSDDLRIPCLAPKTQLINLLLLSKILEKPMIILLGTIRLSQTSYSLLPLRLELCLIPLVLPVDWFYVLPSLKISQNRCPLCFHIILLFVMLIKNKI